MSSSSSSDNQYFNKNRFFINSFKQIEREKAKLYNSLQKKKIKIKVHISNHYHQKCFRQNKMSKKLSLKNILNKLKD